jgi:hypothetical protein
VAAAGPRLTALPSLVGAAHAGAPAPPAAGRAHPVREACAAAAAGSGHILLSALFLSIGEMP